MEEKPANLKDSVTVIEEIQSKLEQMLTRRKADIERDLEERIRAEKAEADKKIEAIQRELDKGRGILDDYRAVVGEYEAERNSLQTQIKGHFEKAVSFQTEIERLAGLTLEELRCVSDLQARLDSVHLAAEEKVGIFRKDIEDRFGIVAQLPENAEQMELKVDLEQELAKLRKIKELLEAEPGEIAAGLTPGLASVPVARETEPKPEPVPEVAAEPEAAFASAPETEPEPAPAAEPSQAGTDDPDALFNLPEINQVMEHTLAGEAREAAEPEEKENFQALFEILERFRKIEPKNGNGEISYFCKDDKTILDGEHMIASIDESIEEAKRLYAKLGQTESPKEQFFIKQEIINYQEVLRKYVLRNVKLCEREGAVLPQFTADILNLDLLKEILEKLSMENWSNPAEFGGFRTMIETLKDAFYAKITPPVFYLKSLIRELGA